jgi:polysaccharide export outer membrane protein
MTAEELAQAITKGLCGAYVRDPRVSVNISRAVSQVVAVDGAVGKPGLYPLSGKMSLLRVIALASSTTEFARENHVVVFREAGGKKYAALYDLRAIRQGAYVDPEIYANDIVVVGDSQARRIFRDVLSASGLLTTPIIALLQ